MSLTSILNAEGSRGEFKAQKEYGFINTAGLASKYDGNSTESLRVILRNNNLWCKYAVCVWSKAKRNVLCGTWWRNCACLCFYQLNTYHLEKMYAALATCGHKLFVGVGHASFS